MIAPDTAVVAIKATTAIPIPYFIILSVLFVGLKFRAEDYQSSNIHACNRHEHTATAVVVVVLQSKYDVSLHQPPHSAAERCKEFAKVLVVSSPLQFYHSSIIIIIIIFD